MFSKPNAIIYVRRSGLVVAGRRLAPARLAFPPEVVSNMEVLAKSKFVTGCEQFFADHDVKGKRVLMVLDSSIIFTKTVELDKSGKPDVIQQAFIDAMPFAPGKRACLGQERPGELRLFATNAELYQSITEALRLAGVSKLIAITPAPAYELGEGAQQLGQAIKEFIADTTVQSAADFSSVNPV